MPEFALVVGGAACVWDNYAAALDQFGEPKVTIVCNDAVTRFPGPVTVFASMHGNDIPRWLKARRDAGLSEPEHVYTHYKRTNKFPNKIPGVTDIYSCKWTKNVVYNDAHMSSGIYSTKIALRVYEMAKIILCGMPCDESSHFFDSKAWPAGKQFQKTWELYMPFMEGRVRSMSGWSSELLGVPDLDWLSDGEMND